MALVSRKMLIATINSLLLFAQIAIAQQSIDSKARQSLLRTFGDSASIATVLLHLSPEEQKLVAEKSRGRWMSDSVVVYVCRIGNYTAGYGMVDNVKGKTHLITYLVALSALGEVADIDVLAYRESYGGEVAYESFRKQFRHKTVQDKLQPGRDIKNISGATISVHAITDGVKRILAAFELIRLRLR